MPKKIFILLALLLVWKTNVLAQCFTYTVVACIDGRSILHVKGNQMWWQHLDHAAPGTHGSCPGPVKVNGVAWTPWNANYTLPNTTTGCTMTASVLQCSYICNTIQAPSQANGWEAIYDFNDNAPTGAHMFTIQFKYYCPTIDAGPDLSACAGEEAHLTANGGATYTWSPATGLSCTDCADPVATLNATTTYTVTGTDVNGCSGTDNVTVNIASAPTVSFTNSTGCETDAIQFTDQSTGNPTQWSWDFGDGSPVNNDQNPSHVFSSAGTYTVSLSATANGCSATYSTVVEIGPLPDAAFTATAGCLGVATDFTDNSTVTDGDITQWAWDFGDGSPVSNVSEPSHTYLSEGTFNVTLTVTTDQGCSASISSPVEVYATPVAAFTWTDDCADNAILFTDQSQVAAGSIVDWAWDFNGDLTPDDLSQNPDHVFPSAGVHSVGLAVQTDNGCISAVTHQVTAFPEPVAAFSFVDQCVGNAIDLQDNSTVSSGTIANWNWDLGDGSTAQTQNVSYDYAGVAGSYSVTLSVVTDNGCTDEVTQTVEVFDLPVANFNYTDVCLSEGAIFTDASTIPSGSMAQWMWDFGDGTTSTDQDPAPHSFANSGTFGVNLTVISPNGCTDDITQLITIFPVPTPEFSNTTECLENTTGFTDETVVNTGSISDWTWDFGDGNAGTGQNPTNTYAQPGEFDVSLTIVTDNGCSNTTINAVTVHPLPMPAFSSTEVCYGDATEFTNNSTIASGTINSYSWDFGDGSGTVVDPSPTHTYNSAGTFPVSLDVTSAFGCAGTFSQNITVNPRPVINASHTDILCAGQTNGTATASASNASAPYAFQWSNATQSTTPSIEDLNAGSYTITVTDALGCTSDTTLLVIEPLPLYVQLRSYGDTCGLGKGAIAAKTAGGTAPFTYTWSEIRDSSSLSFTATPPVGWNTGLSSGAYSVIITDAGGCTVRGSAEVNLIPPPIAAFSTRSKPTELTDPLVQFVNESKGAVSYEWHFGDGETGDEKDPQHSYDQSDIYQVMLIAYNDPIFGCSDTAYQNVEVKPLFTFYIPNAFTPDGDGHNDTWGPVGNHFDPDNYSVKVFNRWGGLIWQSNDPTHFWDRNHQKSNKPVQQGLYVYQFVIRRFDSFELKPINGTVTIYRNK